MLLTEEKIRELVKEALEKSEWELRDEAEALENVIVSLEDAVYLLGYMDSFVDKLLEKVDDVPRHEIYNFAENLDGVKAALRGGVDTIRKLTQKAD